jgi:DNA ligase (NAD+)
MNAKNTPVKFINSKGEWVVENCHDLSSCREHAEKLASTAKLLKASPAMADFGDDSVTNDAMSIFDEDKGMTREEFLAKVARLEQAAESYYAGTEQFMSDAEYDLTLDEVEAAAKKNGWTEAEGLTDRIAAGYHGGVEVTHQKPMLSMAKVKNISELEAFAGKIGGFSLEPKLDGLAVSLTYKAGKLVGAATRGDGTKGESILPQILRNTVRNLEYQLEEEVDVNVRGELYMTHSDFEVANAERIRRTGQPFANSRNATAGIIRNQKTEDAYAVLSFAVYDVVGLNEKTYEAELAHATKLGFKTAASLLEVPSGTLAERVAAFGEGRDKLDYPVDGIVIKASSLEVRKQLGEGAKAPNWAMAFKYQDVEKTTTLLDITREVNRTGAISYTALLESVELEGTNVQKATLNNAKYIADNNIRIGGKVILRKANQIIPQILGGYDNADAPVYNAPTTCPKCNGDLDTKTSVVWRCTNADCSTLGSMVFFTSRDFMDIEGLSESTLTHLLESGKVNDPADLYALTVDEIANIKVDAGKNSAAEYRLLGEKTAQKLYDEIQKSKNQEFARVLPALNIRHLGRRLGKRVTAKFPDIQSLQNATVQDLMQVDGIAIDKAEAIYKGLQSRKPLIEKLTAAGVNMGGKASSKPAESSAVPSGLEWIVGSSFVITGSIEGMNRNQIQERLEAMGGTAQSSVSSKTNYLIVGANAGSKLAKAESLGVKIKQASEVIGLLK